MINYEKLKIAHDILAGLGTHYLIHMIGGDRNQYTLVNHAPDSASSTFLNLDDLILSLDKLSHPKPKYDLYSRVWTLNNELPFRGFVDNIYNGCYTISNANIVIQRMEKDLFPSKAALVDSQIYYWMRLKNSADMPINEDIFSDGESSLS